MLCPSGPLGLGAYLLDTLGHPCPHCFAGIAHEAAFMDWSCVPMALPGWNHTQGVLPQVGPWGWPQAHAPLGIALAKALCLVLSSKWLHPSKSRLKEAFSWNSAGQGLVPILWAAPSSGLWETLSPQLWMGVFWADETQAMPSTFETEQVVALMISEEPLRSFPCLEE